MIGLKGVIDLFTNQISAIYVLGGRTVRGLFQHTAELAVGIVSIAHLGRICKSTKSAAPKGGWETK